jgi:hypothetical protein
MEFSTTKFNTLEFAGLQSSFWKYEKNMARYWRKDRPGELGEKERVQNPRKLPNPRAWGPYCLFCVGYALNIPLFRE